MQRISDIRKYYQHFKYSWKWFGKLICFLFFVYFLYFLFERFKTQDYFPIQEVNVTGVDHIDRQEIKKSLLPLVNKGFFIVDVGSIKDRLLQFPWVANAAVRRVWPNQISIQIHEKSPLALWNHTSVLTTSGEIFTPLKKTLPATLPQFVGPAGEQMKMLNYYHLVSSLLAPLHYKISQLELQPSQSWIVTLNNGMKLNVGSKDGLTQIRHFVKVYPKIVGTRADDLAYVDLRYSNGLALRWKT